jgi:hypothetical protein
MDNRLTVLLRTGEDLPAKPTIDDEGRVAELVDDTPDKVIPPVGRAGD